MTGGKIKIQDNFWSYYRDLIRTEVIPYQWKILNDDIDVNIERERKDDSIPNEKSHAIENFKIAAGLKSGSHYGWVFQDSDVYKWLEAVAYSLAERMDENLKILADGVVDLIGAAQEEDGYLNTYFTIAAPERKFKRLSESHELYCAGHFFEAAAAYYEAAGNEKVLQIACKLADCIDSHFGSDKGKNHGYDGHEEIEIGLMCLYRLTGEKRYLNLSNYFLYIRGTDPGFFEMQKKEDKEKSPLIEGMDRWPLSYYQIHKPLPEQDTAEGHAVRLVYMCTAMADVAAITKDGKLLSACKRIWRNIVDKRMYITGGIGSTVLGESFTFDYDLPNDTMYCETCASVGLIFFARRMLENEVKGEYGDVMERALYNTVLSGMALDGRHFFYVNPLEAVPECSEKDPGKSHVKCVRPEWLGCACCPPNLARLLASLEKYIYLQKGNAIYANLFMNCEGIFETSDGTFTVKQKTNYPWEGAVCFSLNCEGKTPVIFGIRIPQWADDYSIMINRQVVNAEIKDGYIYIHQNFKDDEIILNFTMKVEKWYAHPNVRSDIGKVAITRGPLVYCMESIDNGPHLHLMFLDENTKFSYRFHEEVLGGAVIIEADGYMREPGTEDRTALYQKSGPAGKVRRKVIKWIPYYAWANRGMNEMQVWIRQALSFL